MQPGRTAFHCVVHMYPGHWLAFGIWIPSAFLNLYCRAACVTLVMTLCMNAVASEAADDYCIIRA